VIEGNFIADIAGRAIKVCIGSHSVIETIMAKFTLIEMFNSFLANSGGQFPPPSDSNSSKSTFFFGGRKTTRKPFYVKFKE
jgi:hypothetical protein